MKIKKIIAGIRNWELGICNWALAWVFIGKSQIPNSKFPGYIEMSLK